MKTSTLNIPVTSNDSTSPFASPTASSKTVESTSSASEGLSAQDGFDLKGARPALGASSLFFVGIRDGGHGNLDFKASIQGVTYAVTSRGAETPFGALSRLADTLRAGGHDVSITTLIEELL